MDTVTWAVHIWWQTCSQCQTEVFRCLQVFLFVIPSVSDCSSLHGMEQLSLHLVVRELCHSALHGSLLEFACNEEIQTHHYRSVSHLLSFCSGLVFHSVYLLMDGCPRSSALSWQFALFVFRYSCHCFNQKTAAVGKVSRAILAVCKVFCDLCACRCVPSFVWMCSCYLQLPPDDDDSSNAFIVKIMVRSYCPKECTFQTRDANKCSEVFRFSSMIHTGISGHQLGAVPIERARSPRDGAQYSYLQQQEILAFSSRKKIKADAKGKDK